MSDDTRIQLDQSKHGLQLHTDLGPDVLYVRRVTVHEAVSEPFRFALDLVSTRESIPFKDIVGWPAAVMLKIPDDEPRYFHGIVHRFAQEGADDRFVYYSAELVPWLRLLDQKQDCRIFQNLSAVDIIEKVFQDAGFADFKKSLTETAPVREFCVQYRETDFNFVNRLLEEEGISYHFEHEEKKHVLVLTDAGTTRRNARTIPWDKIEDGHLERWRSVQSIHTGNYALMDFNHDDPGTDMYAESPSLTTDYANSSFRIYDYPGLYSEPGVGAHRAKVGMERREAEATLYEGEGNPSGIEAGTLITLSDHFCAEFNRDYLVRSAVHDFEQPLTTTEDPDVEYRNTFTCIPSSVSYRPPLRARIPVIRGLQTAYVVGKSGEEIDVDKLGRIKVRFHWDRDSKSDDKSSLPVRVAQVAAGKGWGTAQWPRIGQEVTVEFLEGNPDRPLVTGVVYNAQNKPPYELPGASTQSGMRTNSSKGGAGFNELRFEDKKGEEYVFQHAEKDNHLRVKHDDLSFVGNESHRIVESKSFLKVTDESHALLAGERFTQLTAADNFEVSGADRLESVKDGSLHLQVSEEVQAKADTILVKADSEVHVKAGMKVVIEAGSQLTLKVGGNFVNISASGVDIKGTMLNLNSGGSAASVREANPSAPGQPEEATEAMTGDPGEIAKVPEWSRVERDQYSPQAVALSNAAEEGTPFCEECEKAKKKKAASQGAGAR